jgi:uncharacterized protein (DUF1800 family)
VEALFRDTGSKSQGGAWAPYVPGKEVPWNLRRVVHLHRRAGFGATWGEIQRDLADGPGASVDRLLAGKARVQGVPADFEATSSRLLMATDISHDAGRLKAWWVYRMLFGPDPLGERLALLWHNHFATSNEKVADLAAMRRQNECFREYARAPFGRLLDAAVRDPALLVWLDAPVNRKGHPNENLARELMELFTLGVGHYTEADVKEAARVLTGWTVAQGRFLEVPARHDDGPKTVLGRTGAWHGQDLLRMLLEHPATARRLAGRVCELFFGETAVAEANVRALARGLTEHGLDVGWAVGTVLRSRAFFADDNLARRVAAPVEFLVGSVRALELFDDPPSTYVLADWAARLGQNLFYPPNVGGWPGGRAWLTTQAQIARANFAAALVQGKVVGRRGPFDAHALADRHGRSKDPDDLTVFFAELLTGNAQTAAWRARLRSGLDPRLRDEGERNRQLVALLLTSPEVQLT